MRAILSPLESLGCDVVDLVLTGLHTRYILGQRHILLRTIRIGRGKTQ